MGTYILRQGGKGYELGSRVGNASILLGAGTSTSPLTHDEADKNFMEFRFDNGATSGDNRGMYLRLSLTGAGTGGGESLRAFTNVDANMGTAHGAHISLDFAATAGGSECSGLGVATRSTLHIPNIASWAPTGTYAAIQAEIYSDGSSSDPAGMTDLSYFRVVNGGDTTGAADVDTDAYLFSLQGFTAGSGSMVYLDVPGTLAGSLRCKVGSTAYYIPLYSAQDD